jgi:hypothetical protein
VLFYSLSGYLIYGLNYKCTVKYVCVNACVKWKPVGNGKYSGSLPTHRIRFYGFVLRGAACVVRDVYGVKELGGLPSNQ